MTAIFENLSFDNIVDVARARLLCEIGVLDTVGLSDRHVFNLLSTRVVWC